MKSYNLFWWIVYPEIELIHRETNFNFGKFCNIKKLVEFVVILSEQIVRLGRHKNKDYFNNITQNEAKIRDM